MSFPSMTSRPSPPGSRALSRTALTLALLALSGCLSMPQRAQPPVPAKLPPAPTLPAPAAVELEDISWSVVTNQGRVLFALSPDDYETLARNLGEMTRWAREATWQLDFYRRTRTQEGK